MKTRNDDFSNATYAEENNIAGTFVFRTGDGKYNKLELDFSPSSFLKVIQGNAVRKPLAWQEYVKHNSEEEKKQYGGRAGHYIPAKNITQQIASLVEEAPTV